MPIKCTVCNAEVAAHIETRALRFESLGQIVYVFGDVDVCNECGGVLWTVKYDRLFNIATRKASLLNQVQLFY